MLTPTADTGTNPRARRTAHRRRSVGAPDVTSGFTLIELLVVILVMSIIIPAMAFGFVTLLKNAKWAGDTLNLNNDAQRIGDAWTEDVQGVDIDGVNTALCTTPVEAQPLVSFRWQSGGRIATWYTSGAGSTLSLWRRLCRSDGSVLGTYLLADSFGAVGSARDQVIHGPAGPGAFCPMEVVSGESVGRSCTIAIDGAWKYDLTVARRLRNRAIPPPTTTTTITPTTLPPASPCQTPPSAPDNLLCNPGFEGASGTPWYGELDDWECMRLPWGLASNFMHNYCGRDVNQAFRQSGSWNAVVNTWLPDRWIIRQTVRLKMGTRYQLSGWFETNASVNYLGVRTPSIDALGQNLLNVTGTCTGFNNPLQFGPIAAYQKVTVTFCTPPGPTTTDINVEVYIDLWHRQMWSWLRADTMELKLA